MPEGHTIHRHARLQRRDLVGHTVEAWSPQGRFTDGAAELDGLRLDRIDARGKHLHYRWDEGPILHVHLGLFGRFRRHRGDDVPDPTDGTRLALRTDELTLYLSGPTICELVTEDDVDALAGRLGPDPLRADETDGFDRFDRLLDRRSISITAALLVQEVIAGVGNVYRAEILFLAGIDPRRRAKDLDADERKRVWHIACEELARGERGGRIVTVEPADVGAKRRSDLDRSTRLYVYKRAGEPCRRCDDAIASEEIGNRTTWWCPSCQSE